MCKVDCLAMVRIDWNAEEVRSTGHFTVAQTDLAAAFGPVDGLETEIKFTDLLGMVSEPGQIARIKSINPGVPALDGVIRYQLLPDQKVRIEEGRWPFFGGELILEPTVLDFDEEAERNLTFRLIGLDAGKFLADYEIDNLQVEGIFDGTLPMVFNQEGGRIVGGTLVSRPGGGQLSYLGELTYEDMGTFANFAFQALRSIRFNEMRIGVEGKLDGNMITDVSFEGLQQGSLAKQNYITRQLAKIPIKFNVRIEAEFLQLIGSMRGLYDAEYAMQQGKALIEGQKEPVPGEGPPSGEKDERNDRHMNGLFSLPKAREGYMRHRLTADGNGAIRLKMKKGAFLFVCVAASALPGCVQVSAPQANCDQPQHRYPSGKCYTGWIRLRRK